MSGKERQYSRRQFFRLAAGFGVGALGGAGIARPFLSQAESPDSPTKATVTPTLGPGVPDYIVRQLKRTPTPTPVLSLPETGENTTSGETLSFNVIYRGPPVPQVAITIDDGWFAENIEKACDFSEKFRVPLTFFILSNLFERKATNAALKRALSLGCELQNHGCCDHPDLVGFSKKGNLAAIRREIGIAQEKIGQFTEGKGNSGQFFRPPFGAYDATVVKIAHEFNLEVVMWSKDSRGTRKKENGELIDCEEVLNNLRSTGQGEIVLLHTNWNDTGALERFYQEVLVPKGLAPVLLSQLTPSRFHQPS